MTRKIFFISLRLSTLVLGMSVAASCGSAPPVAHANFDQTALSVGEEQGKLNVSVILDAPTPTELRLPLRFNGTADLDRDFIAPQAVVFAPNTRQANFDIELRLDGESECTETATIELANSDGIRRRLNLTITDHDATGRRLRVGKAQGDFRAPSAAAAVAQPGDVVEIAEGEYAGDVAVWTANDLVICGQGRGAHLAAAGKAAEEKAIWVIKGDRVRVENVQFSGAQVSDQNGAGIRVEGNDLTVRHCSFTENENGILAGEHPDSTITVEHSLFVKNGAGDGRSHNIYIGKVRRLNIRFSTLREADVGHNVKSRAQETLLEYNLIMDGAKGHASYQVDVPNGGLAVLLGNVIQQGPEAENWTLVSYGAEGVQYKDNALVLVNNTVVNDRSSGMFVQAPTNIACTLTNNIFAGKATMACSGGAQNGNVKSDSGFVDRARYDYHLVKGAAAIDAGVAPGETHGIVLQPKYEYDSDGAVLRRVTQRALDAGAFEYNGQ